ncbi:MAG: YciI family protein [Gordonia sp. (in: high G+C Gram-positive bacteria)]|uniref:YciI family protein n=1 Tax=Gordonia sp. (in: high G+C Gram-positive bacteria) TaxID=84139 RepID=UPI0039E32346
MKYALLLMGHVNDDAAETGCASPEEYFAFDQEITAAGVVVDSFALEDPDQAVVVRSDASGERVVTAGPYAEVREFVGGTYVIEVADLDEAIAWARRSPGSGPGGHVEIRPVAPY